LENQRLVYDDATAEGILERLSDSKNYPEEALVAYEEFNEGSNTYYFTPGGYLYRKDSWTEETCGFFCGYLNDKVWVLTGPIAGGKSCLALP
jgi:hypothetical protein